VAFVIAWLLVAGFLFIPSRSARSTQDQSDMEVQRPRA
jgi:hypothetical protein